MAPSPQSKNLNARQNSETSNFDMILEVIHKSEFGVSEQSIFVGIILILVNGHPRGGVSAFF